LPAPEVNAPDLPGPDSPAPDLLGPDLPGPDLPGPDLPGPDLATPDLPSPDLPGPDLPTDLPPAPDVPKDIGLDIPPDQPKIDSGAGNCIQQIIANGYSASPAPPCSACVENGNSLAAKCTAMLDCLAPPKTSAAFTNCLNSVAGSSVVGNCVSALTTAGCPTGY